MGLILGFISEDNQSTPASTWTEANVGDDVTGSINELSATAVNITAAGTSDSTDDGTIAYQTISSAQDIQILATIPATWTGTTENFTFFGVQLREALTGNPVLLNCLIPDGDVITRTKHRLTTDGSYVSYAQGVTGISRPKYVAITYDHSLGEVKYWESEDGVVDNYLQVGSTVSLTLSFPVYACLYGTSHNNSVTATAALTNCSVGSSITISQAPDPLPRNIRGVLDWETGAIQESGSTVDGIYTDGMRLQISVDDGSPLTFTNITKDSPAKATYTGTQPDDLDGFRLTGVSGMTELEGRLVRVIPNVLNPNTELYLYQDGDDDGYNPSKTLGNTDVNSTGYGTFTGSCSAQGFKAIHSSSGNPTIPTDADTRVITGITPPTNAVGTADPVTPLRGTYMLMSEIYYWKDYALPNDPISNPLGNDGKNKPRVVYAIGSGQDFNWQEEEWFSFSIYLPTNYDHEETLTGAVSRNQVYYIDDVGAGDHPCEIHLRGNGSGTDQWELDSVPIGTGIVLGSTADDVGKWTTFVIQITVDPSAGTLKIWKGTGAYTSGFERADTLVANYTSQRIGPTSGGTTFLHNLRQYKGSWHYNTATIDSRVIFLGFDEIRYGGVNEGTGFSDVHPFRHSEP